MRRDTINTLFIRTPARLLILVLLSSGCSTIVAERISKEQSHDYSWFITDDEIARKGFIKSKYCSTQDICLSYLSAERAPDEAPFDFDMTVNGDHIRLHLNRSDIPEDLRGTVILLHGFAISKEYMVMTASYFRFLGFDVVIPDMLGHGESEGSLSFGVKDAELVDELIDSLPQLERPLFLFGNSMGANSSVYLASHRTDVDGIVLQAPMLPFDHAALNYIRYDSPFLARLVTAPSIRKGALKALHRASISSAQTDITIQLREQQVPALILASSSDTIAPFSYFQHLDDDRISVVDVAGRSHYSMVVIDQIDSEHIIHWLTQQQLEDTYP